HSIASLYFYELGVYRILILRRQALGKHPANEIWGWLYMEYCCQARRDIRWRALSIVSAVLNSRTEQYYWDVGVIIVGRAMCRSDCALGEKREWLRYQPHVARSLRIKSIDHTTGYRPVRDLAAHDLAPSKIPGNARHSQ